MLSIIIPTLNEEKYLPKLLECLRQQQYPDKEIIISDGSSTDKTVSIAKSYNCKITINKKRLPARQRNAGAAIAKGDVLLFLDADTLLPANFLREVTKEFQSRKLDVAGFYFTLHSDKLLYRFASLYGYVHCFILQYIHPIAIGAAILSRKSFHNRVNGFKESLFIGDDHEYAKSIQKAGGTYSLIKSKKILFHVRRFEKEGPFTLYCKWVYMAFYYMLKGPIKKPICTYEFGKF